MKKLIRFVILLLTVGGLGVAAFFGVKERVINVNQWFVSGMIMGVDVSSYQEDVDFLRLARQGVRFAYVKATEGAEHQDPSFSEKWSAAAAADVPAGAYHYFNYGVSGVVQAQNFIATVGELDSARLIPAVDMELTTAEVKDPPEVEAVVAGLRAFLAVVEERYGVKPMIYAQQDYWDKYLARDFSDYPRWVRNVFYPAYLGAGDGWYVWQYHDRGVLEGYSGEKYIDLNVVNSKVGVEGLRVK